jgi:hypothetical protein
MHRTHNKPLQLIASPLRVLSAAELVRYAKNSSNIGDSKEIEVYFQNFQSTGCCLCGEPDNLTREHKIKRSVLKAELGETELYVGQSGNNHCKPKLAQSTRSKHLKFKARICESCNTDKTQPADREFDNFNKITSEILNSGGDPATVFDLPQYRKDTDAI